MLPTAVVLVRVAAVSVVWTLMDPDRVAVLPPNQVDEMLHQCSRKTPVAGTGYWRPPEAMIAEMEGKVHDELPLGRHPDQRPGPTFPHKYFRQYVGYWRDGRPYLYGSYIPDFGGMGGDWRRHAMRVCDGGPQVFGAEYDARARTISNLAFNGSI